MNDTIKKIQVQMDYHAAEMARLQTALDVIAEYEAKPAIKQGPMFTVQKIGGGSPSIKPASAGDDVPLVDQVLKILSSGKAMTGVQIAKKMNFGDRATKSARNPVSKLKAEGKIILVGHGKYAIAEHAEAAKAKLEAKKPRGGGVAVSTQIVAALTAFPKGLSRSDILVNIDLHDRGIHTFDSSLSRLKMDGKIVLGEDGTFTIVGEPSSVVSEETEDVRAA